MIRPWTRLAGLLALLLAVADLAAAQSAPTFLRKTADDWAAQLRNADPTARRSAAFALGEMGNIAILNLPDIKKALRAEKDARALESMVAAAGAVAAGTATGDAELEGLLTGTLSHADKLVRRSAAAALGLVASKTDAAREALAQALRDPAQEVRQNAAWALRNFGVKAAPALASVLHDTTSDALVKRDAAYALFTAGSGAPAAIRPAMNDLLEMCGSADSEVRKAGLVPLVKIVTNKDGLALPVLKKVLRDDTDADVRRYAALALSNVGGADAAEAVPTLVDALRHGEPHLKRSAAVALHNIGEVAAPAVPVLIQALRDPDPELRKGAALALGGIGRPAADAVPALVQVLTNRKERSDVRIEAAEALTGMKGIPAVKQQIPQLLTVLGDPNEIGDLRIRLAWLFNDFAEDRTTMDLAQPVMAKICGEAPTKANGATRYHCAYLLGLIYQREAPDAAISVLGEWLFDRTGRLYGKKKSNVGASGTETTGQATVEAVLQGDSRIMAVEVLGAIGAARVGQRKEIVQQLRVMAADDTLFPELRAKTKTLLSAVSP